jgi:hypothetical protein
VQLKQGSNNVTQNTPMDSPMGFAHVGSSRCTLMLTIDRTGHIVLAEPILIDGLSSGPITLSGNSSDVVNGAGESVSSSAMASGILGCLLVGKDGRLKYTKAGDILIKKAIA